jgi:mannose-6-phosphate isomerase-like protein (cupin superfamily)
MQNKSRRAALQQMAFLAFGSGLIIESCKHPVKGSATPIANSAKQKALKEVLIPTGTFPKPADGIALGDGLHGGPKVRSEFTNGQMCCQEIYLGPKQAGPPPHLHKELDEVMRVIEGTVYVMVGDRVTEIHAGDWHVRPHGIVHTFWNASDEPALLADIYLNQDLLDFFEEFVRIQNRLQKKELTIKSEEGQKLINTLLDRFGIAMFPDQFPPIIKKYGLSVQPV